MVAEGGAAGENTGIRASCDRSTRVSPGPPASCYGCSTRLVDSARSHLATSVAPALPITANARLLRSSAASTSGHGRRASNPTTANHQAASPSSEGSHVTRAHTASASSRTAWARVRSPSPRAAFPMPASAPTRCADSRPSPLVHTSRARS
jgi:hypothetical protein